jgi:NitT/TauT family transport system ATP-binding protein
VNSPSGPAGPRLEACDLTKRYRTSRGEPTWALREVDLTVNDGEFVSVVGPSGCGKSTLLNCIAGITPYDSGSLRLDGAPIRGPGMDRAVVFQDASLLPWRNVEDNIGYGMAIQRRTTRDERRARIATLVELVGLGGFERHYPAELSGGMRQRVNLARALATEPWLLLMDEPFGALDALVREQLQLELGRICRERRCTALFVTHDIEEAAFLSDRVVVMTGRPGTVRAVVDVDLPRPRRPELKRTLAFAEVENRLWGLLHDRADHPVGAL